MTAIIRFASLPALPASHEDPKNPGVLKKILISAKDVAPGHVQMINWCTLLPNKSFRPHYHETMDEIFIMLSGKVKMVIDNDVIMLQKRDTVIIEKNRVHSMINPGSKIVEYIAIGVSTSAKGKTIVV